MKTKAKTIIEKHGFIDPDRKCSKHDQIQIWAYNNIETVLQSIAKPGRKFDIHNKELECPIFQGDQHSNIVGFVDLSVRGNIYWKDELGEDTGMSFNVSLEIKNEIESCGDLIRQVNFYRKLARYRSTWIVVSPDDRFKDLLKEQMIYFYKYPMPPELRTGQLFS